MSNNLFLIVFTLCAKVLPFIRMIRAQYSCHDDASCLGDIISTSSNVECYGYLSCSTASIVTSDSYLYCDGSYSCFKATQLIGTSAYLYCRALHSCAFVSLMSAYIIYCFGEGSCHGSIALANYRIYCYGAKSCAEAIIHVDSSVYAYGYASVQNSKMFSNATTTYYYFYAGYGADGATVTCNSGHTCYIYCRSNACDKLTLIGEGTFSVDCNDDGLKSDACPDGHVFASFITHPIPNLSNLTLNPINNSYLYQDCDRQCADYQECQNSLSNVTNICCTGRNSCGSLHLHSDTSSVTRCDSYYACYNSYFPLSNESDVDIYATGEYALRYASVYNGNDMLCTARYGCIYLNVYNFTNVYCLGYYSCQFITLRNVQNVFMFSVQNRARQAVHNVQNVYCNGFRACRLSTITNIHGDLYALGEEAVSQSTILNVFGSIISVGYEAMQFTDAEKVTNVCDSVWVGEQASTCFWFCTFVHAVPANSYCVMENDLAIMPQWQVSKTSKQKVLIVWRIPQLQAILMVPQ